MGIYDFLNDFTFSYFQHRSVSGLDHNVKEAWDLGYTGKNVVVTILDDGLERTHPDIEPNYVCLIAEETPLRSNKQLSQVAVIMNEKLKSDLRYARWEDTQI
jgi:hypothetical protein